MGTALAGLLILGMMVTAMLMFWRVDSFGKQINGNARKAASELQGEQVRTIPNITAAAGNGNANTLSVTVGNDGATSVAATSFVKMDVIVVYVTGSQADLRLTYTETNPPPAGQWTDTSISGTFEPAVWNPTETLAILATLNGIDCYQGTVTVGFPNGITDTSPFICEGLDLYFHSEVTSLGATTYNRMKDTTADGTATTISSIFFPGVSGQIRPSTNNGKFVFPLTNINLIPAATWELTYRVRRDKVDQGFFWNTDACDISLTTTASWQDIDLSLNGTDGDCSGIPLVPVGATGVIVEVVNTSNTANYSAILRSKTDDHAYMSDLLFEEMSPSAHRWQMVKLDGSRVLQGYIEHTAIDFKLLGYTIGTDPEYFGPSELLNVNRKIRVIDDNDDAEECVSSGAMSLGDGTLDFVDKSSGCTGLSQEVGMRFKGIPLATGMTVTSAKIELTAKENDSGSANWTFQGEDVDDAAVFSASNYDITGRTRTTASVAWSSVPNFTKDLVYESPDLSTIIQEIIDRGGWANGNDIVIAVSGSGTRRVRSHDDDPDLAPALLLEYSGATNSPIDVTPPLTAQWMPVTVSSYVDADADGVILLVDSQDPASQVYAVREVSSSDEGAIPIGKIDEYGNSLWMVGLNGAKQFEAYIGDLDVKIFMIGQTKGSVVYFDLNIQLVPPGKDAWRTIDADTYGIPGPANGVILHELVDDGNSWQVGLRHGDNTTDDWEPGRDVFERNHIHAGIGINASNEWQYYSDTDDKVDSFIAAYTRSIRLNAHAGIDVVIRDGSAPYSVLSSLATDVANTPDIASTDWENHTISFAMPEYLVTDQTDYLEIDLFAYASINDSAEFVSVEFQIDDPTLGPLVDQMRAREKVQ